MILSNIRPEEMLFLDIETVPQSASYADLPERTQRLWDKKAAYLVKNDETPEAIYNRASIYAEFGKIVCISVGMVVNVLGERHLRLGSYAHHDERLLLWSFAKMLARFEKRNNAHLCAHNGKEFDFPYIARRMLVNGIELPETLNVAGKKPWEVNFVDTMELWKFGDFKSYASLDLLTSIFDIPSPKADMDGSQVAQCYYQQHDLKRIAQYCENDVLAIAQLMMRYKHLPLIAEEHVEHIDNQVEM